MQPLRKFPMFRRLFRIRSTPKATIKWSKNIPVNKLNAVLSEKTEYLYCFIQKRNFLLFSTYKLLYIGMAYKQTIEQRLKTHHKLPMVVYKKKFGTSIVLRFGTVTARNAKMSEAFIKAIEGILIFVHKPPYNSSERSTFRNKEVIITNRGSYRPMKRKISLR